MIKYVNFKIAIAVLWLLNLWDAAATWYAVKMAHYGHEANPAMAKLIERGPWHFFGFKIGLMTLVGIMLVKKQPASPRSAWFAAGIGLFVYTFITFWHIYALIFWRAP